MHLYVFVAQGFAILQQLRLQSAEVRLKDYLVAYHFKVALLGSAIMLQLLNPVQMIHGLGS